MLGLEFPHTVKCFKSTTIWGFFWEHLTNSKSVSNKRGADEETIKCETCDLYIQTLVFGQVRQLPLGCALAFVAPLL